MANSRKPAPIEARVRAFLAERLNPGARLCLGLSGGLDSSVLLHVLAGLREPLGFSLRALHVHHGLSPQADAWAEHCAAQCARLAVPLDLERVQVQRAGQGIEAAARNARYAAFDRADADAVVLAHQRDDQVETFFLRLLRGAGVEGLAAMPAERRLPASTRLLRPLLDIDRADLRDYAAAHAIEHCEDESNADTRFTRNHLRETVLPRIESRHPAYRQRVAAAAAHLADGARLLGELAELDAAAAEVEGGLDCAVLAGLGPARARNLLRHWLARAGAGMPSLAQTGEILRQALTARDDAAPSLHLGQWRLYRYHGRLYLTPPVLPASAAATAWPWHGEGELDLGGHGHLRFTACVGEGLRTASLAGVEVSVRLRAGGERLQPDPRRPRRALKKWLQEAGLPPWQRQALPVLWRGDEVVWAAAVGVDCRVRAEPGEAGWQIDWFPAGAPPRP